jgi:hypothetical protein
MGVAKIINAFCSTILKMLVQNFADDALEHVKTRLIGLIVSRKIFLATLHPGPHLRVVVGTHSKAFL